MNSAQAQAEYRRRLEEFGGADLLARMYRDTPVGEWMKAERPFIMSWRQWLGWHRRMRRLRRGLKARAWDWEDEG